MSEHENRTGLRKSLRKVAREDIGGDGPSLDKSWHDDADAFLESESSPADLAIRITDPREWLSRTATRFKKASRRQHVKSLAGGYALWIKSGSEPDFRQYLVDQLRTTRKRLTKQTQLLHAAVEVSIEYQGPGSLNNRDVQAIRHLFDRGVRPSEVSTLAEKKGEGLNAWSRKGKEGSKPGSRVSRSERATAPPGEDAVKPKGNLVSWVRNGQVVTTLRFADNTVNTERLRASFQELEAFVSRRALEMVTDIAEVISAGNISADRRKNFSIAALNFIAAAEEHFGLSNKNIARNSNWFEAARILEKVAY